MAENPSEIYIIGGGPSLIGFDFSSLKDKTTITVNRALNDVPNPDFFLTMDYICSLRLKDDLPKFNIPKIFIVPFFSPNIWEESGQIIHKRAIKRIYDLSNFNVIIKCYKRDGIGFTFNDFRGDNSGVAAFQFAILMGFNPINLLGFDFAVKNNRHHYWSDVRDIRGFEKKLQEYKKNFIEILKILKAERPDIKVNWRRE